nr:hypothetical protein [candidate division KSB1 bacterium]NIR71462.1 hypothetical protein [candidate division KSB1 bacterium]NIS23383.1 hypothetical protein [candidate division KSB1 bacterium]NIT70274.1 hypothetical protein [candidate division KSB1 bacterium]NIU23997.1 hypothetical protein [candidate division KSB1 bacterium]
FWVDVSGDGDYERRKYLVWQKGQVQAKGKVRWLVGASVKLTAQSDGITQPVVVEVAFPLLLLLVCCAGGAIGGWFRRSLDPTSKIDVPFTMLPGKWSQKLEPLREAFVSMLVGLLLFVFNAVSPLYLEFRSPDEAQWLGLAHPLLLGFIGGWGGINLLIGLLHLRWGRDR